MATSLKELIVTFEANAKPVINALNQIDSKLKRTTRSLQSTGESFTRLGKEIGLALSLPLAAFGGASVKAIADIQSLEASLTSVLKRYSDGIPIQQTVTNEIQYLKDITEELGSSFTGAVKPYVKYLAASKDNLETNRKVIKSFLGLSVALGLTEDDTKRVVRSLEQMQSKGQIMSEELKLQLGDAVPGAVALFAESMNMGTAEFLKLIEKGEVSSKILSKVADTINKKYGESIEKGAKTIRASTNRISNAFYMLRINVGRGMDEVFKVNQKMGSFANWLMKVANNFARLDEQGKKVILGTGLLVAGLGPLLLIIGTLAKLLGIAALGFRILFGLLIKNPLGLLITALIILYSKFESVRDIVDSVAISLYNTFKVSSSFIRDFIEDLKIVYNWIVELGNKLKEGFFAKIENISSKLGNLKASFKDFVGLGDDQVDIASGAKASMANTTNMSSIANNQKTINNNLTVNIPPGTSALDTLGIKTAIKQALQEENRQSYIELGAQ